MFVESELEKFRLPVEEHSVKTAILLGVLDEKELTLIH